MSKARSGNEADATKIEKAGRGWSNWLDAHFAGKWGYTTSRAVLHAHWHKYAGDVEFLKGFWDGVSLNFVSMHKHFEQSAVEYKRAADHAATAVKPSPPKKK